MLLHAFHLAQEESQHFDEWIVRCCTQLPMLKRESWCGARENGSSMAHDAHSIYVPFIAICFFLVPPSCGCYLRGIATTAFSEQAAYSTTLSFSAR